MTAVRHGGEFHRLGHWRAQGAWGRVERGGNRADLADAYLTPESPKPWCQGAGDGPVALPVLRQRSSRAGGK